MGLISDPLILNCPRCGARLTYLRREGWDHYRCERDGEFVLDERGLYEVNPAGAAADAINTDPDDRPFTF